MGMWMPNFLKGDPISIKVWLSRNPMLWHWINENAWESLNILKNPKRTLYKMLLKDLKQAWRMIEPLS